MGGGRGECRGGFFGGFILLPGQLVSSVPNVKSSGKIEIKLVEKISWWDVVVSNEVSFGTNYSHWCKIIA